MTVQQLYEFLQDYSPDMQVGFLCPDGFEDSIEPDVDVNWETNSLTFLSYIHRTGMV